MGKGINKVIIVGNLGNDPDSRLMPNSDHVTTISVATSERWKDKSTGELQERTEWHRVVFFKRLAEVAAEYLRKGSKVYIEGQLRTRKWQADDGSDRYSTEIIGKEMQMLDSRNQRGDSSNYATNKSEQPRAPQSAPGGDFGDFNDDIPF